jgi:hypothetical protein
MWRTGLKEGPSGEVSEDAEGKIAVAGVYPVRSQVIPSRLIRQRIVLSPISLLEVLSQLALHKGE